MAQVKARVWMAPVKASVCGRLQSTPKCVDGSSLSQSVWIAQVKARVWMAPV